VSARVDAAAQWRFGLTVATGALLAFLTAGGLAIYLLPFGEFAQFCVLLHTAAGLAGLVPLAWYAWRHWRLRRRGRLSHHQLLGYAAVTALAVCCASGVVVTWQGALGRRVSYLWDQVHLVSGIVLALFVAAHLATVIVRAVNNAEALRSLRGARRVFFGRSTAAAAALLAAAILWSALHSAGPSRRPFSDDYNWRFGDDRPFAPSLARVERLPGAGGPKRDGAVDPVLLAGSAGCGTSGCHDDIYREWLPSAHRYSSLDDMFQRVQALMAQETSPEHTRYCAGCHDPISLFGGAKNAGNITLSAEGANEGSSCIVCHSIVQTDVQGNGDYTLRPPRRYAYETASGRVGRFLAEFLIRTYPRHHVESYSRPLYKTPEFCGACHKQYVDKEVNTDIGKVQGQNQYDSWRNSRWHVEGDPRRTIACRECHMPLVRGADPAAGDAVDYNRSASDGRHRSHRFLASNQYIPLRHGLPGAAEHVRLTERWLRGEIEIPEIADKWTSGPVVRMEIISPAQVVEGDILPLQVVLTNNKTGHDFPTGPLDMIESWIELTVVDEGGRVVLHRGGLDETGYVRDTQVWFKADGFDRRGALIDRHNLWDLVGASYKRTLYPGMTDTVGVELRCPSMARGRVRAAGDKLPPGTRVEEVPLPVPPDVGSLEVTAALWYRKANPEFLDRVYGAGAGVRSPVTEIARASAQIRVVVQSTDASHE
jgi:hypothetical protein